MPGALKKGAVSTTTKEGDNKLGDKDDRDAGKKGVVVHYRRT